MVSLPLKDYFLKLNFPLKICSLFGSEVPPNKFVTEDVALVTVDLTLSIDEETDDVALVTVDLTLSIDEETEDVYSLNFF